MRVCRLGSRRSVLLALVAAAAVLGSPLVRAAAPTQKVARVGFVSPSGRPRGVDEFWQRLRELGWVEGQNLIIEQLSAEGRIDLLPAFMTELVGRKVDVLVTWGTRSVLAARNATRTVPIVAAMMGDPVRAGLVTNLAHPDGNVTGLSLAWTEGMAGKWLELIQDSVPRLSTVAAIGDLGNPVARDMAKELVAIAPTRSIKVRVIQVNDREGLDRAFKQARREAQAVLVLGDFFTFEHRREVTALAARYRLAAIYPLREYMESDGLMAYGPDVAVLFRRAAEYVDRILRGARPGDLPIEQPTKFELVVNLKTAKALGLTIPESILLRADEVVR